MTPPQKQGATPQWLQSIQSGRSQGPSTDPALADQLHAHEATIKRGHHALLAAANALRVIHDEQLFLAVSDDWRGYIERHAPVGVRQAYRWLHIARIVAALPADLRTHPCLPDCERAYRLIAQTQGDADRATLLRAAIDEAANCPSGVSSQHLLAAKRRLAEAANSAPPAATPTAESTEPALAISDDGNADGAEPPRRTLSPAVAQRMLHEHLYRLRDIQRAIANFPRLRREAQDLERVIIQLQRLAAYVTH